MIAPLDLPLLPLGAAPRQMPGQRTASPASGPSSRRGSPALPSARPPVLPQKREPLLHNSRALTGCLGTGQLELFAGMRHGR